MKRIMGGLLTGIHIGKEVKIGMELREWREGQEKMQLTASLIEPGMEDQLLHQITTTGTNIDPDHPKEMAIGENVMRYLVISTTITLSFIGVA